MAFQILQLHRNCSLFLGFSRNETNNFVGLVEDSLSDVANALNSFDDNSQVSAM